MEKLALIVSLSTLVASAAYSGSEKTPEQGEDSQVIYRAESQKSFKGPEQWFTGDVQVDMLFPDNETAHYSGAYVTFQPGARTAWHLHPAGQHMIVTSGVGLTGTRDGRILTFKAGDTVWCPPGIDHWHGATPDSPMTHLVLTGVLDGKNVVWKEKVTDEQYLATRSEGNDMEKHHALSQKQQWIIPIAAFTADGDIDRLNPALNHGLDAGLTVNEIKEVLTHLYAYTGFPRSLNALSAFMEVMDERKAKGIEDTVGKEASPIPPDLDRDEYGAKVRAKLAGLDTIPPPAKWQQFSPVIDTFLKEHLFADLFVRDVLSHQERELATISALANMTGTEGQLRFHLGAAINTGLTEAQMKDFISVLKSKVSRSRAESAQKILTGVLKSRSALTDNSNASKHQRTTTISVKTNGKTTVFELNNSPAARDLYAQLPLNIKVENYGNNEKIFYPPKKLNTTDTPQAEGNKTGILAYYAPWGDVVMFYKSFDSARGLYALGQAISGVEFIQGMSGTVQIEKGSHP